MRESEDLVTIWPAVGLMALSVKAWDIDLSRAPKHAMSLTCEGEGRP